MPSEDSQPNEARILPKGAGVPAVRPTPPSKRPAFRFNGSYRYGSRPPPTHFQSGHSRNANTHSKPPWHSRQMPHNASPAVSHNAHPSSSRPQAYAGLQVPNFKRISHPLPPLHHALPGNIPFRPLPNARLPSNIDRPVPSPNLGSASIASKHPFKRRALTEQEDINPAKKSKDSAFSDDKELIVDIPATCKYSVRGSRRFRNIFEAQSMNTPRKFSGAKSYENNRNKLIDTYFALRASQVVPDLKATPDTAVTLNEKASSGSDIKLEDLEESHPSSRAYISQFISTRPPFPSQVPMTSAKARRKDAASTPGVSDGVTLAPLQIPRHPRPFRLGNLTLTHGPLGAPIHTPSPPPRIVSPSIEVIEFKDTPPSSPQVKEEKITADNDRGVTPAISESTSFRLKTTANVVRLPKNTNDKARRVLVSHTQDMLFVVSMRGFVQEITRKLPRRERELYSPLNAEKESIEDVCLLPAPHDDIAIVAQTREECALSLIHLADRARMIPIDRTSSDRNRMRRGVSAVAALPTSGTSLSFVSAGYDHIVHLWSLDAFSSFPSIPRILDVRHTSAVQSLLVVKDTAPRLLSAGADCCVHVLDLNSERKLCTFRTSNSAYQLHSTVRPECVLLEVAHRDLQFELHDYRTHTGRPERRFGFESSYVQGRYNRGSVDLRGGCNMFVSGDRDGRLRLWDLRNLSQCKQEVMCFPGQRIVHAKFDGDNVVVISDDNRLMFFNTTSAESTRLF